MKRPHYPLAVFLSLVSGTIAIQSLAGEWPSRAERDAAAKAMDIGESAPDWLVESESYAEAPGIDDWAALAASKVAFVTHCPVNREYFNRIHALGIRAFPYVSFYQGFAGRTTQGVRLDEHPEFIEVDKDGNLKRTGFWESEDAKNMYATCPAEPAYQDAMVAWVGRIMELGADGVFIDNLSIRKPCFGVQFGKHKHVNDDPNQAFALLLQRVREVVKKHKPDGALLGNSGVPLLIPREYWKSLDAEMLESYMCTWVSTQRWYDWHERWHDQGVKLQPFIRAGKQIQALSYLGSTHYGRREDAFYCYATARLAGFVWSCGRPISDPEVTVLYQLRLGPPLGPEQEDHGVYYRLFERGLVVVNPDKSKPAVLHLPKSLPASVLDDVFSHPTATRATTGPADIERKGERLIDLAASGWELKVPAYCGRVYLYAASMSSELSRDGPTLIVATDPPLAEVRFRVDGFDYWTHSGHWTTEYVLGPNFGKFDVNFEKPGRHTVEIVDVVPADMKTRAGYSGPERLGQFMDPSQPTRPSGNKKFRFREWSEADRDHSVQVDVQRDMTLTARFDIEVKKP